MTGVAIAPVSDPAIAEAVSGAGGRVVDLAQARALVWLGGVQDFPALDDHIEWVALKTAGIEEFVEAGIIDDRRIWTNASGFYAENVAEHALALLLAGLRQINTSVIHGWDKGRIDPAVRGLHGSTVAIVGAGGIGASLIPRLNACEARVLAVNTTGTAVPGAHQTFAVGDLDQVWAGTDHVVVAAPSTRSTHHMINASVLTALPSHSWVVNVARGTLVDQDALVDALVAGEIAGAALDVTDPEPLPADHPLWTLPNVIITPHVANPSTTLTAELAPWIAQNLRRFIAGDEMIARVTPGRDY